METQEIKNRLLKIANDNCTLVYTDKGQGSSGPGSASAEEIIEMIDLGCFDDAKYEKFRHDLARDAFNACAIEYDGPYYMISFDRSDNFARFAFLWND